MSTARQLLVLINGTTVGTLSAQDDIWRFAYAPEWMEEMCDLQAGGGNDAVLSVKLRLSGNSRCRRSNGDVSHDRLLRNRFETHHLSCQAKAVDRAGLADRP